MNNIFSAKYSKSNLRIKIVIDSIVEFNVFISQLTEWEPINHFYTKILAPPPQLPPIVWRASDSNQIKTIFTFSSKWTQTWKANQTIIIISNCSSINNGWFFPVFFFFSFQSENLTKFCVFFASVRSWLISVNFICLCTFSKMSRQYHETFTNGQHDERFKIIVVGGGLVINFHF